MSWLEIAAFVALGLFAGAYGTLVGVGGGLFIVPVLIFAHFAPKQAIGTSMAVVLANGISGSIAFLRQKRVAVRTGLLLALAGLPGALVGAYVDQLLPKHLVSLLFGLFLVVVGLRMFLSGPDKAIADSPGYSKTNLPLAVLVAFFAGFIASLFGVGGGIIYVPTMFYLLQFPAHVATATSTFAIALTALFGTASHAYYVDIVYGPAIAIAVGAIGGAQIGASLASRVRAGPLIRLFSIAIFVSAFWLIYYGAK